MGDVCGGNHRGTCSFRFKYFNCSFIKSGHMRTTIIFLGMCIFGIAGMIFLSTKKGQEWMKKFD